MKREVRFEEPEWEGDGEDEEEEKDGESVSHGTKEAQSREARAGRAQPSGSSWTDMDLSIMLALAAPIGNWLTGTDHLKNVFLICLLIFYLHQIIEVPWQLYQSAVPRKLPPGVKSPSNSDAHLVELAKSELRQHEFFYLILSLASPFIGAYLLRLGLSALSSDGETQPLSWFSITLFMLAVGIRPWSHLIKRLRARTLDLHDTVHYHHLSQHMQTGLAASSKLATLSDRIRTLETELQKLRTAAEDSKLALEDEHDELGDGLRELKVSLKKYERKSDLGRTAHERRIQALETTVGFVLEHLKRQEQLHPEGPWNSSIANANANFLHHIASTLLYVPSKILSIVMPPSSPLDGANGFVDVAHSPSSAKSHVSQIPGLEMIAEDSDDDSTLSPPSVEGDKPKRVRERERRRQRQRQTIRTSSSVVQDLVTLPYRAAQRVLVIATSPIQKHLM
ncbi:hypothetical protein NEOLEDRAFT_1141920 [Neolentinus lepideus HHB14362 ss-1]|uniref:Uncharacterized protein n=1 Tax=Neolentinus lepideus HHB14362 ss-1 TaxID=1314782 RepID=A0A165NFP9_9AGAM|nr:hypothetical protein NEOLEDRAFT_1141920 [Neolentinus lepideus HHB14362 ss-1]